MKKKSILHLYIEFQVYKTKVWTSLTDQMDPRMLGELSGTRC